MAKLVRAVGTIKEKREEVSTITPGNKKKNYSATIAFNHY